MGDLVKILANSSSRHLGKSLRIYCVVWIGPLQNHTKRVYGHPQWPGCSSTYKYASSLFKAGWVSVCEQSFPHHQLSDWLLKNLVSPARDNRTIYVPLYQCRYLLQIASIHAHGKRDKRIYPISEDHGRALGFHTQYGILLFDLYLCASSPCLIVYLLDY